MEQEWNDTCSIPQANYWAGEALARRLRQIFENGRRYHGYHDGAYFMPNDKREQDRMDMEHRIFRMVLNGKLYLSPLAQSPGRVLDLGTGAGPWAMDFAEAPQNCTFEIDDFEDEWPYDTSRPFNFIHARNIAGCVADYDRLFAQAFKHLSPGGYLELQSSEANIFSDDGTIERAVTARQWRNILVLSSKKFGKRLGVEDGWKKQMEQAGFVDVVDQVFKVPFRPWPKDPKLKELGLWQSKHINEAIESYSLALFTRVLGWTVEELDVLLTGVRNDFADPHSHLYGRIRFVYGRKPE
ncbi:hypothetical protein PRK78_007285 [Emydomyces testavorans]|uniref:Methyltransferase n=1 Tax=Emydomyces testavorans TaxID=2070801 RepID=A0AAF0DP06_9EURO|nr:hypothetical protein PRK78_007285 [Emydomyces testavorans]